MNNDHSLPLSIADELTRMEANLSHMPSDTRGYKQLCRSIERMKDILHAHGYSIVNHLGKPYLDGMRVMARFVIDEQMHPDEPPLITGVTKPQVNYQNHIIQVAEVTVSQPL